MCEAPTQEAPESPLGGFPCPACGARTGVINSRPFEGSIRRRRVCPSCGLRISTLESIVGDSDNETIFKRHIQPRLIELRRWLDLLDDGKEPGSEEGPITKV